MSREFCVLRNTKRYVELLRAEADAGDSSIYKALCGDEGYCELAVEYWRTVETACVEVPKLRKFAVTLKKAPNDDGPVVKIETAVGEVLRTSPLLRPGNSDVLSDIVLMRSEALAKFVVTEWLSCEWVADKSSAITSLLDKVTALGTVSSLEPARATLATIQPAGSKAIAVNAFEKTCVGALEFFNKTTICDVKPRELNATMNTIKMGAGDAGADTSAAIKALDLLKAIETLFVSPVLAEKHAFITSSVYAFAKCIASKFPADSEHAGIVEKLERNVKISDAISSLSAYLALGP